MSGGYFINNNLEWTAEDIGEFAKELEKRDEDCFSVHEFYRKDMEAYQDLDYIADHPDRMKRRILEELAKIKTGLLKAAEFIRAVDNYAAGDTGPDTFLLDLAEIKDKYGSF
jgi:hypothetical protein